MSDVRPHSAVLSFSLPAGGVERCVRLWSEAVTLTGVAVFISLGWGVPHEGTVSLFLVAASLMPRLRQILRENTEQTVDALTGGLRANATTAASVGSLFFGVLCGYATVTLIRGPEGAPALFGPVLDFAQVSASQLPGRRFPSRQALLVHEYTQLIGFFGLAFLYRAYAVTLALAFSGCVWGATIVIALAPSGPGLAPAPMVPGLIAIIPTATLESLGLLLSSASAVLVSGALVKYRLDDPALRDVMRSGLALFATGGLVHLAASLYEWHIAGALIR